jgi:hypothetical protein
MMGRPVLSSNYIISNSSARSARRDGRCVALAAAGRIIGDNMAMSQDASPTRTLRDEPATTAAMDLDAAAIRSPYCREIRSKRYFFLREMPTEEHHLKDGSNHCWCRATMKVYGPDGEMVRPTDCTSDRSCYRSLFEPE